MRQVVAYKEVKKQWKSLTVRPKKVVAVAYRRSSFTRGSSCKALTGKILVFWIGGRLRELVVHGGSIVSRSLEQIIPGIKGTEK